MKTIIAFLTFFALGCHPLVTATDTLSGNGLEVDTTSKLRVVVENPSPDAEKLGLTRERIEARVNQILRKAGITPAAKEDLEVGDRFLYVNINVGSPSFSVTIQFERRVFYQVGNRSVTKIGTTWHGGSTGTHGGKRDFILDGLAGHIEIFCNEFLKANGK